MTASGVKGRVALVTGSSRGTGRAIAEALAEGGAKLVVNARRQDTLEHVVKGICAAGGVAIGVQADVACGSDIERLVDTPIERWGRIDVLVNNVGLFVSQRSEEMPLKVWEEVLRANLTSAFACSQIAARHMKRQRSGCIINISSVASRGGLSRRAAYCSAKAGLEALTRELAVEWAPYGIRVNAVAPGFIRKAEEEEEKASISHREEENILSRIPLKRWTSVEDVARCVTYLAGREAENITGEVIAVDGGWNANRAW